ncbi:VRR-NUC domain-containing protein, partial [Arthrospira platensis SPKY1]|nr:VRR-NUC domain-containing protein [Arthrospira platensis SPKY1]
AMGLLAGVPDLLLLQAPGRLYAFELKTSTGRVSPEQAKLHHAWGGAGVEVQIIRSLDEFQQAIKTIIP